MKKVLASAVLAVLLGVGVMLVPHRLFIGETTEEEARTSPETLSRDTAEMHGLPPASRLDVLFLVFMLALSFVIALSVMRYSSKKTALQHL